MNQIEQDTYDMACSVTLRDLSQLNLLRSVRYLYPSLSLPMSSPHAVIRL